MPDYRLTHAAWLDREVAKVRQFIVDNMDAHRIYNETDMGAWLRDSGFDYTNAELLEIGAALIAEGIIELV